MLRAAFILFGLLSAALAMRAVGDRAEDLTRFAPTADHRRVGEFLVSDDGRTKCPRWVLERVTAESLQGTADRDGLRFLRDPGIPSDLAADPADYRQSGYDLGHAAPAADHVQSAETLRATFTAANAMPQFPGLNRGPWARLEEHVRSLASAEGTVVWIVTAPAWLPTGYHESNGAKTSFLRFTAIGQSRIWIPTHCAKAVLIARRDGSRECHAWLIPNQPTFEASWETFAVSTDQLERDVGLDLWAVLPDEEERRLEAIP